MELVRLPRAARTRPWQPSGASTLADSESQPTSSLPETTFGRPASSSPCTTSGRTASSSLVVALWVPPRQQPPLWQPAEILLAREGPPPTGRPPPCRVPLPVGRSPLLRRKPEATNRPPSQATRWVSPRAVPFVQIDFEISAVFDVC